MDHAIKPRDIRERTFEFAVQIVGLCDRLRSNAGVSGT
jgi:hypothetical protein